MLFIDVGVMRMEPLQRPVPIVVLHCVSLGLARECQQQAFFDAQANAHVFAAPGRALVAPIAGVT